MGAQQLFTKKSQSRHQIEYDELVALQIKKVHGPIMSAVVLFCIFLPVALCFIPIDDSSQLLKGTIYGDKKPVIYRASSDLTVSKYNYENGDKVNANDIIFYSYSDDLVNRIQTLSVQINEGYSDLEKSKKQANILEKSLHLAKSESTSELLALNSEIDSTKSDLSSLENEVRERSVVYNERKKLVTKIEGLFTSGAISAMAYNNEKQKLIDTQSDLMEAKQKKRSLEVKFNDSLNRKKILNENTTEKISRNELQIEEYNLNVRHLESTLKIRENELDILRRKEAGINPRAEHGGIVEFFESENTRKRFFRTGEPIFQVFPDSNSYLVRGYVLEKDIRHIALGQEVKIRVDAYNYLEYGAIVGRVSRIGIPKESFSEITIEIIDSKNINIAFGYSIKAEIIMRTVPLYIYLYKVLFDYE